MIQIIRLALKEHGYDMEVRYEPGRRALYDALAGNADGLLMQASWLQEEFPTLVRVEQRISQIPLYFYAYTKDKPFDLSVCHDVVGIINGFDKAIERYARQLGCTRELTRVVANYPKQLLNLLQGERVDWVLAHVFLEKRFVQLSEQPLHRYESSAFYLDIYMYLNARHADLAEPLALSLKRILQEESGLSPYYPVK